MERLRATIEGRTFGQLHNLRIDESGRHLVVHGKTDTYYSVQLVIQLSQQFLDSQSDSDSVSLNLRVKGRNLDLRISACHGALSS